VTGSPKYSGGLFHLGTGSRGTELGFNWVSGVFCFGDGITKGVLAAPRRFNWVLGYSMGLGLVGIDIR
jgi:hypothetical protein